MNGTQVRHRSLGLTGLRRLCLVGERRTRAEAVPQGTVDCVRVIMPERVARNEVRSFVAVSLRFPGAGNSAQG